MSDGPDHRDGETFNDQRLLRYLEYYSQTIQYRKMGIYVCHASYTRARSHDFVGFKWPSSQVFPSPGLEDR